MLSRAAIGLFAALRLLPAVAETPDRISPDGRWRVVVSDPAPEHVETDPVWIEIRGVADDAPVAGYGFAGDAADERPVDGRTFARWTSDAEYVVIFTRDRNSTVPRVFGATSGGFRLLTPPDHLGRLAPAGDDRRVFCWRGHFREPAWREDAVLTFDFVGVCEFEDGARLDAGYRFEYDYGDPAAPRFLSRTSLP